MTELTKAVLYKLKDGPPARKGKPANVKVDGSPITVQFNPASLKIQRSNNIDRGGSTTRTQRRQNPSQQPATLTLDLEFDTAEGDENGQPLDVRTRTKEIRKFVEPDRAAPSKPPPRVLFLWGTFTFAGIITQLTEDIDYFSRDGMALRAKLSLTVTEQNLAFEAMQQGAGARQDTSATPPGGAPAGSGPGSSGTANPVQAALAREGESIQQLLSRLDEDPAAWRSAMNGLAGPLSLAAGAQVQLGASLSVSAGIGVSAGFEAGASVGFGASADAGLSAGFVAGAGGSAVAAAGFALSAGGGIVATENSFAAARGEVAVAAARASFAVPVAASVTVRSSVAAGIRPDVRVSSYGRGVPLSHRADVVTVTGRAPYRRPRWSA